MTDTIASLNNNVPASPQFGTDLLAQINTALTAIQPLSATEAGYLDSVTAGTAAASKAVVLDANKKISDIDITALKLNGNACDEAFLAAAVKAAAVAAATAASATAVGTANPTNLTEALAIIATMKAQLNKVVALGNDNKAKINLLKGSLQTANLIS